MEIRDLVKGQRVKFQMPNSHWTNPGPHRRQLVVDAEGWAEGVVTEPQHDHDCDVWWVGVHSTATDGKSAYVHVEEKSPRYLAIFKEV